jgi:hypothetical protein
MEVYGSTDICWQGAVQSAVQGLRASRSSGASFDDDDDELLFERVEEAVC